MTGLIGANRQPAGLEAVVSEEPVGGSVALPFLTYQRPDSIQGDPGTQLEGCLNETITVPPETMRDSVSSSFQLPPAQHPPPAATG